MREWNISAGLTHDEQIRAVALQLAMAFSGSKAPEVVLDIATRFEAFIREKVGQ